MATARMICAAEALAPDGRYLPRLAALASGDPARSPAWLRAWYTAFGNLASDPVLVAESADGSVRGALALTCQRHGPGGMLRMLRSTTNGHSQYATLLLNSFGPAETVDLLLDALLARRDWDMLRLQGLGADNANLVANRAAHKGLQVETEYEFENRFTLFGPDRNAVLPARSRQTKKKRAGQERALRRTGEVTLELACRTETLNPALQTYLEAELRSWKADGGELLVDDLSITRFYQALIDQTDVGHRIGIYLLRRDSAVIAGLFTIANGPTIIALKTFFDHGLQQYSPGLLLLNRLVEDTRADPTLAVIDFFSGRAVIEPLTNETRAFKDLTIWHRHSRARTIRRARGLIRAAYSRRK